jgi:hypothetical protein
MPRGLLMGGARLKDHPTSARMILRQREPADRKRTLVSGAQMSNMRNEASGFCLAQFNPLTLGFYERTYFLNYFQ